jgi:hypothetical protein
VAQRDQLLKKQSELASHANELRRALRWRDSLERRRADVRTLEERLVALKRELDELSANQPERKAVVAELSERFANLLTNWGFPKVDQPEAPYLNDAFVPHVQGRVYREIGSDGAKTLISIAWALAVFEVAIEHGAHHPGFLMIDSIAKNLAPRPDRDSDEFVDPVIVEKMYRHLLDWCAKHPRAQVIVVDHEPPALASNLEVIRYTRRWDMSPYGLIDDETGKSPLENAE